MKTGSLWEKQKGWTTAFFIGRVKIYQLPGPGQGAETFFVKKGGRGLFSEKKGEKTLFSEKNFPKPTPRYPVNFDRSLCIWEQTLLSASKLFASHSSRSVYLMLKDHQAKRVKFSKVGRWYRYHWRCQIHCKQRISTISRKSTAQGADCIGEK